MAPYGAQGLGGVWGNRAKRAEKPTSAYAPHGTILVHFVAPGRSWDLYMIECFALPAKLLTFAVSSRDCDLPQSPVISKIEITSRSLEIVRDRNFES